MQKEKLKIFISGSFGNQDIGDDAMLTEHLKNLYSIGIKKEQLTLCTHQIPYSSRYFDIPTSQFMCSKEFKKIDAKKYDCMIFTGGGTINVRNKEDKSLRRTYNIISPFIKENKPIFLSGQTIGPFETDNDKSTQMAKRIIDNVDILTIRDDSYSLEYIKSIDAKPKQIYISFDDAINLSMPPLEDKIEEVFKNSKTMGLNLTTYTSNSPEKIENLKKLTQKFIKDNYKIILIPHTPEDYKKFIEIFHKNNEFRKNIHLINTENWKAEQIKTLISKCNICIGGRYHFIVFSSSSGTPTIGMAGNNYSYIKQHGFTKMFGNSDCIFKYPYSVEEIHNKAKEIENKPILNKNIKCKSFEILNKWIEGIIK